MKCIKKFESFKQNNQQGDLISQDDIINCIKRNGNIYATIIQDIPDNDPDKPLKPVDIDQDDLIMIQTDDKTGYVKLKDVDRID